MTRAQKFALFNVVVISVVVVLTGATVGVLAVTIGMPRAWGGLGVMGLFGVLGLSPFLFRKGRDVVDFDEREVLINYRAVLAAYSLFFPAFTLACMIPWFVTGPGGTIPANVLPMMLGGVCLGLTFVHSAAVLIQHGRKS